MTDDELVGMVRRYLDIEVEREARRVEFCVGQEAWREESKRLSQLIGDKVRDGTVNVRLDDDRIAVVIGHFGGVTFNILNIRKGE